MSTATTVYRRHMVRTIICAPRRSIIGVTWCTRAFRPVVGPAFCISKCVCTATIVYRRHVVHFAFRHSGRSCFLGIPPTVGSTVLISIVFRLVSVLRCFGSTMFAHSACGRFCVFGIPTSCRFYRVLTSYSAFGSVLRLAFRL